MRCATPLQVTNLRLRGYEICDCHRAESLTWNLRRDTIENRYFEEPIHGVRLYYFQSFAHVPFRQHTLEWLNVTCNGAFRERYSTPGQFARRAAPCEQARCAPGACWPHPSEGAEPATEDLAPPPGDFLQHGTGRMPPAGALAPLVRALLPSDVVVNAGMHWRQGRRDNGFATGETVRLLGEEVAALQREGAAARFHWRTTTAERDPGGFEGGPAEYAFAAALRELAGFQGVFDAWAVTEALRRALEAHGAPGEGYWDPVHFHGPVYAELNRIFVAYLCSLPAAPRLAGPAARGPGAGRWTGASALKGPAAGQTG